MAMTECIEPYAEQYVQGRRSALDGKERDTNPYFSREDDAAGVPESHEVWRAKYDVWRQGWIEGRALFEQQQRKGVSNS